ncbi:MAG: hypothetical protein QM751_05865 [Paludibacteraceae bacterium]
MNIGSKIFAAIAESTGIGYVAGVALDGAISGAAAWAIGAWCKRISERVYRKSFKRRIGRNLP